METIIIGGSTLNPLIQDSSGHLEVVTLGQPPVVVSLVSASDIGASDGVYKDQGGEINIGNAKLLTLFIDLDVNDSTGNYLKVLVKHTYGGATEYVLPFSSDYIQELGGSDINLALRFSVEGFPHVQIQTKADDVDTGGGTEGTVTINYTLV